MNFRNITSRLTAIIKHFSLSKSKVISKFLIDMLEGISRANSVKLTDIAAALFDGSVSVKHIHKRLQRNLGIYDLLPYKLRGQREECAKIDEDTLIFIDPTDIVKKHGKKFEAIGRVRDACESTEDEPKFANGYYLNTAVALKKNGELLPLELSLISPKSENFVSENAVFTILIDFIFRYARGLGTFILDRGFDRLAIIRRLYLLCLCFIIRVTSNRKYIVGECKKSLTRDEVFKQKGVKIIETSGILTTYNRKTKRYEETKSIIRAVEVKLLTKLDGDRPLYLVQAKSPKLRIYFLTSRRVEKKSDAASVVEDYFKRRRVEDFIRFVKQQYELEDFRVLSLGRIKNLLACLYLTIVSLTRVGEIKSKERAVLNNHSRRATKIKKESFEYYRLADGLRNILATAHRRLVNMWKARAEKRNRFQLKLPIKAEAIYGYV